VAVNATEEGFPEDEVIIIGRESRPPSGPPPYLRPSPHPYEPSEGPPGLMVPGCMCVMLLRGRMFTHPPISRVSRDIRQRQASVVQRGRPPGPKFMIPLPVEYKYALPHIITIYDFIFVSPSKYRLRNLYDQCTIGIAMGLVTDSRIGPGEV
jgi:hypothetical protein